MPAKETEGLQLKYFVLKPKGIDQHARASRAAMRQYAKLIMEVNPKLASDLREWADREMADAFSEGSTDNSCQVQKDY